MQTQLNLTRRLPFCYANLLGTHNSGITLADGYGNLDPQFEQYFKWIKWVSQPAHLRTNDQWLSLTDQMNLGVRVIELDTHYFEGELRIAHCGGLHSTLDTLVNAVNVVAKLLHHDIRWDSETIGCEPSLSSIPCLEQRTLKSALLEIADWLNLPGNRDEFLVIFFDDQKDLLAWEMVPTLLARITAAFPQDTIWTPTELAAKDWHWPSINDLVAAGKRIMFISGIDYGREMNSLVFSKGPQVCGWVEPHLSHWMGAPTCAMGWPGGGASMHTMQGQLIRVISCEILYGPMNCDFVWGLSNDPLLDVVSLPDMARCGVNMPSPDLLTPARTAATIWSWASGHPFEPYTEQPWYRQAWLSARDAVNLAVSGSSTQPQCAAISAEDGRWRAYDCAAQLPTACRDASGHWQLAHEARGTCPEGYTFEVPHHAKENMELQIMLKSSPGPAVTAAWLPMTGPTWAV
jgi:hypothetical protein